MEVGGDDEYQLDTAGGIGLNHDNLIGNYINCWIGQSTDETVIMRSASGGIVTTLLIFALNSKMINGALVTKNCGAKPKVILAENEIEIRSASGSKYCPVPLVSSVKEISKRHGKFAVVGLPCHIRAIRKLESLNKELKDKIVLHIGLFCSHGVSFAGTEFLLENLNIRLEDVIELRYRAKRGRDTGLLIKTKNGSEWFIPSKKYWKRFFAFFFVPFHCLKCHDLTSELADVSVGDAWLSEFKSAGCGQCVFITRNHSGSAVVQSAINQGLIRAKNVDSKTVIRSQNMYLHLKKRKISMLGLLALGYLLTMTIGSIISLKTRSYSFLKVVLHIFRVMK